VHIASEYEEEHWMEEAVEEVAEHAHEVGRMDEPFQLGGVVLA